MARTRLPNYLRTHRRRHCLSQAEIATLLGARSGTKISRYENFTRVPAVPAIFAYEVVFNQPVRELFAGSYQKIRVLVRARAKRLLKKLSGHAPSAQGARLVRKLTLLRSIIEAKMTNVDRKDT